MLLYGSSPSIVPPSSLSSITEVVRFGTEDIITTSFVNDGGTEGNIGGGEDTDEWGPETP